MHLVLYFDVYTIHRQYTWKLQKCGIQILLLDEITGNISLNIVHRRQWLNKLSEHYIKIIMGAKHWCFIEMYKICLEYLNTGLVQSFICTEDFQKLWTYISVVSFAHKKVE